MIKVLIVEDSATQREILKEILESDPSISIVKSVVDGKEAISAVTRYRPDIVVMDIHMPRMNGVEATQSIMETNPLPIVVVSASCDIKESKYAFMAMNAGALAVMEKPASYNHFDYKHLSDELIRIVKALSSVKVVKRRRKKQYQTKTRNLAMRIEKDINIMSIGASTGGPPALKIILSNLPKDFPIPIVIVQHICRGFTESFVEWLQTFSEISIKLAEHNELLLPGTAYFAPDGYNLTVSPKKQVILTKEKKEGGQFSSVSMLFTSIATTFKANSLAIILSGMGTDGANELKQIRENGGTTIAQDQDSSVVHGMPGSAIKMGGADYILSPIQIADFINCLALSNRLRHDEQ